MQAQKKVWFSNTVEVSDSSGIGDLQTAKNLSDKCKAVKLMA